MKYKDKYLSLLKDYQLLKVSNDDLRKTTRILVNYILRIRKKCENENLWLIASKDPYKPLDTEHQQGEMVGNLYYMTSELKKRIK
jgi:hypothetical protein